MGMFIRVLMFLVLAGGVYAEQIRLRQRTFRTSSTAPPTLNTADYANAYDDAWQSGATGWVQNAKDILAANPGQTAGMVLWIGDSLTRDAAMGAWAQSGSGKTTTDSAITTWMHAGQSAQSVTSIDGFALAAPYFCSARSYTVGDGLGSWDFMGSCGMPADTNQTTARTKLNDCATYNNCLHLTTMLHGLERAQFAIVEVNLDADQPAVFTDLEAMWDALEARGVVPIVITYTYRDVSAFNTLVDTYNTALVAAAQSRKYALIDLNQEMKNRIPFTSTTAWDGRFLADGVHYTTGGGGYTSTSDPYSGGGNAAIHLTGAPLTYNGYGLKGWLGVQKMKEIKQLVIDN
jgi:hypothetical protein